MGARQLKRLRRFAYVDDGERVFVRGEADLLAPVVRVRALIDDALDVASTAPPVTTFWPWR